MAPANGSAPSPPCAKPSGSRSASRTTCKTGSPPSRSSAAGRPSGRSRRRCWLLPPACAEDAGRVRARRSTPLHPTFRRQTHRRGHEPGRGAVGGGAAPQGVAQERQSARHSFRARDDDRARAGVCPRGEAPAHRDEPVRGDGDAAEGARRACLPHAGAGGAHRCAAGRTRSLRADGAVRGVHRLRAGELAALRIRDVDFLRRHVEVRRMVQRVRGGWRYGEPKTARSRRDVPLRRTLLDELTAYLAEHRVGAVRTRRCGRGGCRAASVRGSPRWTLSDRSTWRAATGTTPGPRRQRRALRARHGTRCGTPTPP